MQEGGRTEAVAAAERRRKEKTEEGRRESEEGKQGCRHKKMKN